MEKTPIVGRLVMVHPDLTTDPIHMQIGKVIAVQDNIVEVEFYSTLRGKYMDDALLTTLPKQTILSTLVATSSLLDRDDCKTILKVCKHLSHKEYERALLQAKENEVTRKICTINCEKWQQLSLDRRIKRNFRKKI